MQSELGEKGKRSKSKFHRQEIVDCSKLCEGRQHVQSTLDWCGRVFE